MVNSLQQVYKKGGILAFVAIIWLLSDFILALWMNYIGGPILGKIESTCINDLCVLVIMFMFLWFLWNNKNQEEKHFLFTNIGLCLLFGGGILYFYPRFTNIASFTLFYNFPILAYADIFPLCIILSIFNKKWRKSQKDESDKKGDSIKAAIKSYLENKTNYAIMIANVWGAGKTYYWKNALAPMILKEGKHKPIYVTTFGIQSVEELHSKIIEEIHPIFKGYITKMLMVLCNWGLRVFGANLNSRETNRIIRYMNVDWDKYVICIDDFERIAKEGSIVGLMGYLNELIEHYHTKIIFIANEEEIKGEKHNIYKEYKEKLIRYTHLYSPNMKEVILEYASKIRNKSYARFLEEQAEYITEIYRGKTKNLRTLFFNLEKLESIHIQIKSNEYEDEITKHFLFLSIIYSIEYMKHNDLNIFLTIDANFAKSIFNIKKHQGSINYDKFTDENKKKIEILEEYYPFNMRSYKNSKALIDYISSGTLSRKVLSEEINEYIEELKKKEIPLDEIKLEQLELVWDNEDEDMQNITDEAIKMMKDGEVQLKNYPLYIAGLLCIRNGGFAELDLNDENLKEIAMIGIEKSKHKSFYTENISLLYEVTKKV